MVSSGDQQLDTVLDLAEYDDSAPGSAGVDRSILPGVRELHGRVCRCVPRGRDRLCRWHHRAVARTTDNIRQVLRPGRRRSGSLDPVLRAVALRRHRPRQLRIGDYLPGYRHRFLAPDRGGRRRSAVGATERQAKGGDPVDLHRYHVRATNPLRPEQHVLANGQLRNHGDHDHDDHGVAHRVLRCQLAAGIGRLLEPETESAA